MQLSSSVSSRNRNHSHPSPATTPPQEPRIIKLTPALFRRLDVIARTMAGRPIRILTASEMKGDFAHIKGMCSCVYQDANEVHNGRGLLAELAVIDLANKIDVEAFHRCPRPEMDWRAIPENLIYDFLVQHEVGHCRMDPCLVFDMPREIERSRELYDLCMQTLEMRADRYAWKALFPGNAIPKRRGSRSLVRRMLELQKRFDTLFFKKPRTRKPITTDPNKMVPMNHVRDGIVWADLEGLTWAERAGFVDAGEVAAAAGGEV